MRILKVIDTLEVGGAEKVFIDLTNLLFEKGVDVSVLFVLKPGSLANQLNKGIQQVSLNRGFKWSPLDLFRCVRIICKYDIIHCHNRYVYAYINLSGFILGLNAKIILHDHYGLIDLDKSKPFNISGIFKPRYFIGVSINLTNWATQVLNIESSNVFLLANIVRRFISEKKVEKKYDWILVSNIKPVKNQLFAVELAKIMNRSLLIIGNIQDYKYYNQLLASIENSNCKIEIKTNVTEVRNFMQIASMGLHVSKSETGPLTLIEYLSVGLPFVAFDTGEVAKTVKTVFPEMVMGNLDLYHWEKHINFIEPSFNREFSETIIKFYTYQFNENEYVNKCLQIYQEIKKGF